jgi:hypothetical protein
MAAKTRSRARSDARRVRFPCGHIEPAAAAERRMRFRGEAAWVRCVHCTVIAFLVQRRQPPRGRRITRR